MDPAILCPVLGPEDARVQGHLPPAVTAALGTAAKEQPRVRAETTGKATGHAGSTQYCSTTRTDETVPFSVTKEKTEVIMLSEVERQENTRIT